MRSPRFLLLAITAFMVTMHGVASVACYDSYWVERLRSAQRLARWAVRGVDFKNYVFEQVGTSLGCRIDYEEDDPLKFKKKIDSCLCWNLRINLIQLVQANYRDELNALPASASLEQFYLRSARPQIAAWRRAIILQGDRSIVGEFDSLVDRCFTQPHSTGAVNSSTPATSSPPPVTSQVPVPPPTVDSPAGSSGTSSWGATLVLLLLGALMGGVVAIFCIRDPNEFRRNVKMWMRERRGLRAVGSPRAVSNARDEPALLRSDELVQRSINATE